MDEKADKQEVRENAPEKKGSLSGPHLVLALIGVIVALCFIALITWICVGAKVEEKKENKAGDRKELEKTEAPEKVSGMFAEGRYVVDLPVLKRPDREDAKPVTTLVEVKAGKFVMSEFPVCQDKNDVREVPHEVTLTRDFYIGATEVTQAQWKALMGIKDNGAEKGKAKKSYYTTAPGEDNPDANDDLPVETVTWNEAMAFCEKLNKSGAAPEGWMFTLPTETQWEFAARGGVKSKGFKYSGGDDLDEVAWCRTNNGDLGNVTDAEIAKYKRLKAASAAGGDKLQQALEPGKRKQNRPVARKKPNELGLYDMNGNVWEWCLDDFPCEIVRDVTRTHECPKCHAVVACDLPGGYTEKRILSDSRKSVPEFTRGNDKTGVFRVIRGGSWYTKDEACTPCVRSPMSVGGAAPYLGFRLALVRKAPEAKAPAAAKPAAKPAAAKPAAAKPAAK